MTHPMTLIDDGSLNGLQHITFAIASEIPIFVVCLLLSSSSSLYRKTPSRVVLFFPFFFFFRGRILRASPCAQNGRV
jgi:hypothetical protein